MLQKIHSVLASLVGLACFLGAMACPGPQPLPPVPPGPPPATDAATDVPVPGSVAETACASLARLQCPEGLRLDCVTVVQKAIDTHITDLKLGCLIGAQTVEAVRACGSVSCK
jgi:hypothetical protein